MQISKPVFIVVIIFAVIVSGGVGYMIRTLEVDTERAEMAEQIVELEEQVATLELQLIAAEEDLKETEMETDDEGVEPEESSE